MKVTIASIGFVRGLNEHNGSVEESSCSLVSNVFT